MPAAVRHTSASAGRTTGDHADGARRRTTQAIAGRTDRRRAARRAGDPHRAPADARDSASTCAVLPTNCSSTTSLAPRSPAPSARCSRPPCPPRTTASTAWTRMARSRAPLLERQRDDGPPAPHRRDQARDVRWVRRQDARPLHIARTVRGEPRDLTAADVAAAHAAGAIRCRRPARRPHRRRVLDVQPDGRRLSRQTPPTTEVYRSRAGEIAAHGYSDQRVTSVPG